jgi:energy-coupling factor transporter ATP-binding protein EcfA2
MTSFYLFYYKSVDEKYDIGALKIQYKDETSTIEHIDDKFLNLSDNYCSLGQEYDYYLKLKRYLGDDFMRVLFALKDAAFFSSIQEKFENNSVFINSLIRDNYQERLLREIKHIVYEADLETLYQFEYNFKPCYSDTSLPVKFKFERTGYLPNRIYALIGQNGTGKTQFITSLPLDLSKKKHELFTPAAPLFSKIIAVSYGAFDNFKVPQSTVEFNYIYCGLKNEEGHIISETELEKKFSDSWIEIKRRSRVDIWINILSNFLDTVILNELIILDKEGAKALNFDNLTTIRKKMSSGQTIMLYVISEIVANIRYDSLLLYDEPETHLHPNAISQLMNTIQELILQFQSYCIITTHSPLIIRELLSKSVYIVDKNGDVPSVRNIEIESYGENLGVLNDIVFGNREIPKFYKQTISRLIKEGLSYEEIIALLESDQVPLSLSLKIYIKSLTFKG